MQNAIVTAADLKYLPAACCALISCVRDGEVDDHTSLFLLACDVSASDAENAHVFLEGLGASAKIVVIEADRFRPYRIDGHVSASTYSRLLLPEIFDDRWDRLLYLDADTRVMVPLKTLLEGSLQGSPIGAVHDYLKYIIFGMNDSRTRLLLKPDAPYFNAGVVCFDWRVTIASGLIKQAQAFAAEKAHLCVAHDQDALNKAFEGAWAPLDPRWNFLTVAVPDEVLRLDYPVRFRPYISHFAGPLKPWMANFPERFGPHRAWYHDLLCASPLPDFVALASAPLGSSPQESDELPKRSMYEKLEILRAAFRRLSRQNQKSFSRISGLVEDGETCPGLERLFDAMIIQAVAGVQTNPADSRR